MDKNQIRKDVISLIENIKSHFDNALNQDHIPQLELETIVNKIEKLHQKAIILHYLNDKHTEHNLENIDTTTTPPVQTDLFGSSISPKTPTQKGIPSTEKKEIPVNDIHTAIGINEKFQFINNLFEGNTNEYTAALNQLNNYTSFEEAEPYLNSINEIYKWKDKDPLVETFLTTIKRKLK